MELAGWLGNKVNATTMSNTILPQNAYGIYTVMVFVDVIIVAIPVVVAADAAVGVGVLGE